MVILNAIVLIFEILYYSLFMKFARKEGKITKYLLLFTLVTIIGLIIGTNNFPSYLLLIMMILFGLKYIVKVKISLYDMLVIMIMLVFKTFIEAAICLSLYLFLKNTVVPLIIANIFKIIIVILFNKVLNNTYINLKEHWNKNNFYIRYIFSCLLYMYVIVSIIFLIFR